MKPRQLTLHQIWLLISGITLVTVLIFTFDPERMLPISLMRGFMVAVAIALFTWGLLQLAISYANYQLERAGSEREASASDQIPVDVVLPPRRGRRKGMVRIPISDELVHVSDPRVTEILATLDRAKRGDADAAARVRQWNLAPSTVNHWNSLRRELGPMAQDDADG